MRTGRWSVYWLACFRHICQSVPQHTAKCLKNKHSVFYTFSNYLRLIDTSAHMPRQALQHVPRLHQCFIQTDDAPHRHQCFFHIDDLGWVKNQKCTDAECRHNILHVASVQSAPVDGSPSSSATTFTMLRTSGDQGKLCTMRMAPWNLSAKRRATVMVNCRRHECCCCMLWCSLSAVSRDFRNLQHKHPVCQCPLCKVPDG